MNTETWEKITPNIIEGYQNMNKHARATPNCWVLKNTNGIAAHLASYEAMKIRYDAKILTIKEEVETSHDACQAYDDKVTKLDKYHCCAAINAM